VALSGRFEKYLDTIEPLASEKEVDNRKQILHDIQKIVNKWVQQVSKDQGFTNDALRTACGKVFTFGSFRLGLITPSSDIDTLVVAPKHISRDDFFGSLLPILEQNKDVSELSGVPDAIVPIIKMKFRDVEVDLTFARLNLGVIDSKLEDLKSNDLLKHLDEKTVRSINGTRVADDLLSVVPNPSTYRTVLRFIRNWAKKRGLYSNAMGFFGGITWAILSARVCQMYPNYTPLQICNKFFLVFSRWNWSNPVTLCPITQSGEVGLMGFKIWNPRINKSDKYHLMPIITPSFPCMNSTYNVTETTRRILISEFSRGCEILAKFSKEDVEFNILNELTISPPFLSLFSHYFVVDVVCQTENAYNKLKGFVESRIRMLLKSLESPNSGQLKFSRPWPKEFDLDQSHCCWLIGLSFDSAAALCDLRPSITSFHEKLNEWSEKENYATEASVRLFHTSRRSPFMISLIGQNKNALYNQQVLEWLSSREDAQEVPEVTKKRKIILDVGNDI
jgi:poly(A) polymerase